MDRLRTTVYLEHLQLHIIHIKMNARELFLRKTLPVFINSFNQYTYLRDLIESLVKNKFCNLWILDNNSDYTTLVEYYRRLAIQENAKVNVLFYGENRGPHYFYFSEIFRTLWNYPHFYTDPDILFECFDTDFAQKFVDISDRYKVAKVGAALTIPAAPNMAEILRPMPETNNIPVSIREWEERFWKTEIEKGVFQAPIDTTFHYFNPLYYDRNYFYSALRLAGVGFEAIHRPWFKSDSIPREELEYYLLSRKGHGGWM